MAAKKELSGEEEVELARLWKKLVKLYHPHRFAHEPQKLETYGKLTAAINRAKDSGDLETLRQVASDPHGFIFAPRLVEPGFSRRGANRPIAQALGKSGAGNPERDRGGEP